MRTDAYVARALTGKVLLTTHHGWHYAAAALAVLDRPDEALVLLERAVSAGLADYPAFRDDGLLGKLKDHSGCRAWLAGLECEWLEYRRDFGTPRIRLSRRKRHRSSTLIRTTLLIVD